MCIRDRFMPKRIEKNESKLLSEIKYKFSYHIFQLVVASIKKSIGLKITDNTVNVRLSARKNAFVPCTVLNLYRYYST